MPEARSEQRNPAHVRALAVVVIYRMPFAESKTLAGLARAFAEDPSLAQRLDVLVWENGPEAQEERELPFAFTYQHSGANEGVSGAYNARRAAWLRGARLRLAAAAGRRHFSDGSSCAGCWATLRRLPGMSEWRRLLRFYMRGHFACHRELWRFARHMPLPRPAQAYRKRERFSRRTAER